MVAPAEEPVSFWPDWHESRLMPGPMAESINCGVRIRTASILRTEFARLQFVATCGLSCCLSWSSGSVTRTMPG